MNSVKQHLYLRRHKIGGYVPPLVSSDADPDNFVHQHRLAIAMNPAQAVKDGMDQMEIYSVGELDMLTGEVSTHQPVLIADLGSFVPNGVKGE